MTGGSHAIADLKDYKTVDELVLLFILVEIYTFTSTPTMCSL